MGMYSTYKHLRIQHGNLLNRLINLENSLRNFDSNNCYLNVCEREQYSVELDGKTGKKIIQNEIDKTLKEMSEYEYKIIKELKTILNSRFGKLSIEDRELRVRIDLCSLCKKDFNDVGFDTDSIAHGICVKCHKMMNEEGEQ